MAPKSKCVPCMSKDLKQLVRDNTKDLVLIDSIDRVPDCPELGQINFCFSNKRAASPYQQFIKECLLKKPLKGKPFGEAGKYMKECAIQWRFHKEKYSGERR